MLRAQARERRAQAVSAARRRAPGGSRRARDRRRIPARRAQPRRRAALRELLSDEIDHGRIGWAHIASLPQTTRDEVSRWLLPMAFLNLRTWREHSPYDRRHRDAWTLHGVLPANITDGALLAALRELIVPGLKALRMRTETLETWLDAGAPTDRPPTPRS